ncbi:uncharacterized protein LOC113554027 isoform X2 [Rhopalosiphum maidis]|uniref:uncharacterized protein LOC113554027 isoform X2 n=1 Tax=Rhopalosiphum maidis TaxID=43146 RepID=UPI000EFF46F8|nr:uncharacterized protein LOC113554027 isoform X2 [Rhopalosiphum maidis]
MTINTFEFSKGIIIIIMYNMIILTSIKCNDFDIDDNLTVPDYDTKLIVNDNNSYFEYHFRNTSHPGQLKINPTGYFYSIYNCTYTVLPEVDFVLDDYSEYILNINKLEKMYKRKYKNDFKDITKLKNQEFQYVTQFKIAYNATKEAYEAVEQFENMVNEGNVNEITMEYNKEKKNDIIEKYLQNQMPELHYTADGNTPRYVFENYELYVNPTEDIYYMSNVKQAEYDSIKKRMKGTCNALNESEYYEVILLYHFLPEIQDSHEDFKQFIVMLKTQYQESYEQSSVIFKEATDTANQTDISYELTFNKLKSKFVVNNENFMSYLIRLKKQGSVGFHQVYHTSMYKIRKDNYGPGEF